ncbi:uncharacterized protein LOC107833789 isoform X2 [Poecilia formosa]|nr:PREDICTED: uncharacterized protein LOC107833789 isoform X2 [Poecilia formosa]
MKDHKTNRAFGSAKVYLTPEEFGWLERWLDIHTGLEPEMDLVIFTDGNRRFNKLLLPIQKAWSDLGLPGAPTVTDIRTSIATYARDHLPADERRVISGIMCHDISTAEEYAVDRSCRQLAMIRRTFDTLTDPGTRWESSSGKKVGFHVSSTYLRHLPASSKPSGNLNKLWIRQKHKADVLFRRRLQLFQVKAGLSSGAELDAGKIQELLKDLKRCYTLGPAEGTEGHQPSASNDVEPGR